MISIFLASKGEKGLPGAVGWGKSFYHYASSVSKDLCRLSIDSRLDHENVDLSLHGKRNCAYPTTGVTGLKSPIRSSVNLTDQIYCGS